ncbi:MAG TPA: MMPL family transporter, partial [Verrucomicrobiota bacterium]|nr:MMPL family transporter [Verrucomicrobiota bacterium]
ARSSGSATRPSGPAIAAETAAGMERDMVRSVLGSALLVAALFAWAHRSWRPLAWILGVLGFTLAATLALGGILLGPLQVVSLGFAAILLGLAADYGLVLQEESGRARHRVPADIRREQAPAILWSAATTAAAFLALTLGGLPGLAQLGVLAGLGVLVAAGLVLATFGPQVIGRRRKAALDPGAAPPVPRLWPALTCSLALMVAAAALVTWRLPRFDASTDPLRPARSESHAALDELQREAGVATGRLWLIISGPEETAVAARLDQAQAVLAAAQARGDLARFDLPTALWPRPARGAGNPPAARALGARRGEILAAARAAGFTDRALLLADRVLAAWAEADGTPAGDVTAWALDQVVARDATGWHALAAVTPARPAEALPALERLEAELGEGFAFGGWDTLGAALRQHAVRRVPPLLAGIGLLAVVALALAFRRAREVVLSVATLALAGLLLLAVMAVAGWRWNLMNLLALLLLLGAGLDYTIHVQFALRRHGGRWPAARGTTGRAVLLCGLTTTAAFGSLAWSGNGGLASLGRVCVA